ncbi:MAG: putative disulfide formation protein [Parcubacteria group bacterium GW2011_GWA2_47_7]|nr:MAG: putative disulfide formation protein [Parcubacteria group bacterium GW2011_GWA2_47_7]
MELGSLFTKVIALGTLFEDVLLIALLLLYLMRNPIATMLYRWSARHALILGFLMSASATIGSLLYSEVVGFPACILCWTQRIFMYPMMFLFALAFYRKDGNIFVYTLLLSLIGGSVALYQWIKDMLASYSHTTLPCPAVSDLPSCDKIFVFEYGYITIPMFALTAFIVIALVSYFAIRSRKNEQ